MKDKPGGGFVMKDKPNTWGTSIDELLNGFIDGELTESQRVEVERLISDDQEVTQRLGELEKCKVLVGSLPHAKAPAETAEQIKASLEKEMPSVGEVVSLPRARVDEQRARRGLPVPRAQVRRVLATAAMIGLIAILTMVIYLGHKYTNIGPEGTTEAVAFKGRLELETSELVAVDSFINKAVEDNGLSDSVFSSVEEGENTYTITCSREGLNLLLADLGGVWEKFDSARLLVETQAAGGQVTVENVSAKDIVDLVTPPKPRLTGDEKKADKPAAGTQEAGKVELTIVIVGSK